MRVIVCGSRRWHDRERIASRLFDLPSDSVREDWFEMCQPVRDAFNERLEGAA